MTPAEKLDAKRTNESIKLSAALLNNMAVGLFVGGIIAPTAAGRSLEVLWYIGLIMAAACLHAAARLLLRHLKSEE